MEPQKRILKIRTYKTATSNDKNIELAVFDENHNPIQGKINVEQLDDIILYDGEHEVKVVRREERGKDNSCEQQEEIMQAAPETTCENECTAEVQKRYFVYNPAHGQPKKIYDSYEEAAKDMQAIADKYGEGSFYVLEIKKEIKKVQKTFQKIYVDGVLTESNEITGEIPF